MESVVTFRAQEGDGFPSTAGHATFVVSIITFLDASLSWPSLEGLTAPNRTSRNTHNNGRINAELTRDGESGESRQMKPFGLDGLGAGRKYKKENFYFGHNFSFAHGIKGSFEYFLIKMYLLSDYNTPSDALIRTQW